MRFSRRTLLKASVASATLGGLGMPMIARAQAAEFTYKYANNAPDSHPMNVRAKEMAAAIKADTHGRFDLQIFPNNQLGSDTDMLSQLRSGGIEFFTLSGLILAILVPAASINGIGFAFPDYDTVWKAMDGDLGALVRAEITKANLVSMDKMWDNGFRQTTSSTKPINTPDDYKGFKIRVPVSPLWTSMFWAFDASPASINFSEVYSALQTKIVEGQENPLALISTATFTVGANERQAPYAALSGPHGSSPVAGSVPI
jgi:tripartite ATP-independent transporter DctP family solute receptor